MTTRASALPVATLGDNRISRIRNMQASKAAYMFRKKLGKVQYLAEPCKPILTHILPKFRGIEAPSCKLVWKPADYVVDVVVVDPPVATP